MKQNTLIKICCSLMIEFCFIFTAAAHMNPTFTHTHKSLIQIANSYEKAFFDHHPEAGMYWGRTDVSQDRFTDHSMAAYLAWQKAESEFLSALIKLDENDLKGSSLHVTYQLLKQYLESKLASRLCKEELWYIDPLWGWHNKMAMIAEKQPVGTPENRAKALKRWQTFSTVVKDEINNLRIGLSEGYSAPKPAVQRVLKQLKLMIDSPIENSPYFEFAKRDGNDTFKKQVAELIVNQINPSLKIYAEYLETEYLPAARTSIGVSSLPNGAACYQSKIRQEATLNIPPNEIFDYGMQHMRQLQVEVQTIGLKQFGTQSMVQTFHQAKHQTLHSFKSDQDILRYNQAALSRAKLKSPSWFDKMPNADGIIKPYPLHRAQTGAAGEYHPPSNDGAHPGIFYINTYEPQNKSRIDQEATLFHELIPGHHFQVALSQEDKSHHSLNKYLWNAGYGEGWALYVERLADEMGLYQDDISRLGMLSNEALRTARLVVDPGIHVMNWSREQAVQYLKEHTALEEHIIEGEVDRYMMHPGQATSYMLGKREIESLRQLAKDKLKDKFDIRQYHNQVLKNGSVTLPMLRDQIHSWLKDLNA